MIIGKPTLTMIYIEDNARIIAKVWRAERSVARWRRQQSIPDYKGCFSPLDKTDLAVEEKLIRLVESGWLKARTISKLIWRGDRINALLTARRYPDDPRFHVKHLNSYEIKMLKKYLDKLQRTLGTLLYLASTTPEGQPYSDVVQSDLRALLKLPHVSSVNVRANTDSRQVARFWAFVRGRKAKREDLDVMLGKMKLLITLLA